jgi:hypothetical protein
MLRITAVSIVFLVQVAVAHAAECVPILEGALLCELRAAGPLPQNIRNFSVC